MSTNPTTRQEMAQGFRTADMNGGLSATELTPVTHLELPYPNATQQETFDAILRCDAAEAPTERLIEPSLARDVLLQQLSHARDIRSRYNRFDPHDPISETELFQAYCEGTDAYAGLITLAPPLAAGNEQAMSMLCEWSRLAVQAVDHREGRGQGPSTGIYQTPAALIDDWEALADMRHTLAERAEFERMKQYWQAAQAHDTALVTQAFVGDNATRLNRAKALFSYAHELPDDAKALKIACLEESVAVIHNAIVEGQRPREDDLVGIYEYFMLESMLGRTVHDIVWLDGHDTTDNRARWMSVQYLTNAADALDYVRYHLITSQQEPEHALRLDALAFDGVVTHDPTLQAARHTMGFLVAGLDELDNAQAALLDIANDPYDYPSKDTRRMVAERRVAYLQAKADYEQLTPKIAAQLATIRERFATIHAEHHHLTERLLAQRTNTIGDISPGTDGHRLANLVLDIDQQLNQARYFATLYASECRTGAQHEFALHQELGLEVVRLLEMIDSMQPDDASMDAEPFRVLATK